MQLNSRLPNRYNKKLLHNVFYAFMLCLNSDTIFKIFRQSITNWNETASTKGQPNKAMEKIVKKNLL